MNYKKLIGFGLLIYTAAFLVMSGFVAYGAQNSLTAKIITLLVIAIATCHAGKSVKKDSAAGIKKYSIGWVVIVFILNVLICSRFVDNFFSQWNVWVGYALILLIPLLPCKCCKKSESKQQPQQTSQQETQQDTQQ